MRQVRPLGQIGAEISGVDVRTLDDTGFAVIYRRGAEGWHTDGAYDPVPFKATQLYAIAIPTTGGHYRDKWRTGDVVIWDNRCSYHLAAGDYPPEEDRIHRRVSIHEHGRV